jgi:hypothetical protein
MRWEHFALNTGSPSFTKEIERVMTEHELLIERWSPIHLDKLLRTWFWKEGVRDVEALDVWQKTCQYLYMPRLKDSNVFGNTLSEGSGSRDFYGLAMGKRDDKYQGFSFGVRPLVHLDSNLIVEPHAAAEYDIAQKAAEVASRATVEGVTSAPTAIVPGNNAPTTVPAPKPSGKAVNKRFYATISLDPLLAKKQFAEVVDEVVQQFTTKVGGQVEIIVELQARSAVGFDEAVQRTVRENCSTLKFKNFDFEPAD